MHIVGIHRDCKNPVDRIIRMALTSVSVNWASELSSNPLLHDIRRLVRGWGWGNGVCGRVCGGGG
jgi:hypothetical protein